jgi:hypothetical protein
LLASTTKGYILFMAPRKTPRLTVVPIAAARSAAPANLGEAGAALWRSLNDEYVIDDAGGREMLLQICSATDRAEECASAIAQDGPVIRTKSGIRDHPLLKHELAARSFIVRSLHRLGLDIEPTRSSVGRPPGTYMKARGP